MKYLLDFDRTVFDMEALYLEIARVNPRAELGTLASLQTIDLEDFLFPDAIEFFKTHDSHDIEIVSSCSGLSGQWDLEYQKEKIERTGIRKYVQEIHVVRTSKVDTIQAIVASENTPMVFVDDHRGHIKSVVEHVPLVTAVCIERGEASASFGETKVISSLSELDAIIAI